MAERSRRTTKKAADERKNIVVDSFEIRRAHEFKNGNISFDMTLNGIKFYSAVVVKGSKGDFISWPQRKVEEDYFSYYWIPLDQKDIDTIIDAVYDKLDEK